MAEIGEFMREFGVPLSFAIAFGWALLKVGSICGTLLIESWKAKDTRVGELDKRVETLSNGQRTAVEQALARQLDLQRQQFDLQNQSNQVQQRSTDALNAVATALNHHATKFGEWAKNRPCLHDSDVVALQNEAEKVADEMTPDPKTLERIARREERRVKREGEP